MSTARRDIVSIIQNSDFGPGDRFSRDIPDSSLHRCVIAPTLTWLHCSALRALHALHALHGDHATMQ
jgi:hypothetical protein